MDASYPAYPPMNAEKQPPYNPNVPSTVPPSYPVQPGYGGQPAPYGAPPPPYPHQPMPGAGYTSSGQVTVVTQPGAIGYVNTTGVYPNNTGAIIFSCFVYWCCCCVLGIIAFVFAVTANSSPTAEEAHQKVRTSTRLSIAGVITGVVLYVVFTALRITLQAVFG